MAKRKPPTDDTDESPKTRDDKKLIEEALSRYKKCIEADSDNRKAYREDMLFTYKPGEQWDDCDKKDRGKDRPMYEFNETRVKCMSVINHIRANRPAAKIRGVEEGDKDLAEIRQGLYLNITNNSDFDSIKDYAAGHQVAGGYGAWRVDTQYSTDTAWDQDIVIKSFINPLCVIADYSARDELKRDAKYWFVHTKITEEAFESRYPDADKVSFEPDELLDDESLDDEDGIWIAEYWKQVPITKHVCLLSDGKTIDKDEVKKLPEGVTVAVGADGKPKERTIKTHKIVQYIISSKAILEGPNDWAGKEFPFVPVYGYYIVIEGKIYWGGLTRYAKDPQRALNWALTSVYETIASAPQSKYWATPEQAKGNANQWAEANKKNLPAMLYNPDPQAPGPPSRMGGADVPVALIQGAAMARDGLKASLGIFDASLGQTSNETSGKAIRARQDEGMVATFNFGDNMSKSERRTCEIVNDLIEHIYDTERSIRILGQDGAEKFVKINTIDPATGELINDMSAGKFDFVVTSGPSFATQRQEAAEFYTGLSQTDPTLMAVAGDLIIKSHDYPMADAIAERKRLMLPPQIQAAIDKDKPVTPEVAQAMMKVDQIMQEVQAQAQAVSQAAQEAQAQKADAEKAKADVQVATANLKVQEANLATDVANFKTLVAQSELKLNSQQQGADSENEKAQLGAQLDSALANISQQAAALFQQYAKQLAEMHGQALATAQPQVVVANPPKRKRAITTRQNGQLVTDLVEIPEGVQ